MKTPATDGTPRRYFNPYKQFTGTFVPAWLLERTEISLGAKLTYARLARYAGQRGVAFPKQTTLALSIGVKPRMLRNYLRELVEAQLIEIRRTGTRSNDSGGGAGRPSRYLFVENSWASGDKKPDRQYRAGQVEPDRQYRAGQVAPVLKDRARGLNVSQYRRSESPGGAAPRSPSHGDGKPPQRGRGYDRAQSLIGSIGAALGPPTTRRSG